jgi:hypothetical protein
MQSVKTLYNQPVVINDSSPPTTIRVLVPSRTEFAGGVPGSGHRAVTYVLYDVLPDELKQRVVTAIQALTSAM